MQPQPGPVQSGPPPDWYVLLGVQPTASREELTTAVERMSRQATALSVTAPERSRQLRDQIRAIKQDLLSGDAQRQLYDARRQRDAAERARFAAPGQGQVASQGQVRQPGQFPPAAQRPPQGQFPQEAQRAPGYQTPGSQPAGYQTPGSQPAGYQPGAAGTSPWQPAQPPGSQSAQPFSGLVSRVARFLQTGWTCKACGFGALPNDKFCQKCGSPIEPPVTGAGGQQPGPASFRAQPAGPAGQPVGPAGQPVGPAGIATPGARQPDPRQPGAQQPGAQQPGAQQPGAQQAGLQQPGPGQPAFCGKCGRPNAAGNTFCTQCGAHN
jgi:hypothetical protein